MITQVVYEICNSSSEFFLQNCVTKLENYVNLLCYEGNWHKDAHRTTLQMLTDKLLINYYFHMLLLQVKMCKLFKGG